MSFAWSLKPLFIWLLVTFGFDLDISKPKAKCVLKILRFICFIWFIFICAPLNVYYVIVGNGTTSSATSISSVYRLDYNINWILDGILNVLFHISILASAFRKWQPVWEKLKQIQDIIGDESQFYHQIRRCTDQGLIVFCLVRVTCV